MKYLISIFAFIVLFAVLSAYYSNPFKLYFIMGKKGSGKSTLMVKKMLKYQRKGWLIYTDMREVNIPDVRLIDSSQLQYFRPPSHSVLFLGEVGITYDNRKFSEFADGVRDLFKFERKYKFICFMDSQSYDIDKKLRDLVDTIYIQTNIGNIIGVTRPVLKNLTLTHPVGDSEARIVEDLRFAMPWCWEFTLMPRYHKYFDSFDAPARKEIPYTPVPPRPKKSKHRIRSNRRRKSK